ncbi:hypothetical protein K0M31_011995 [Melipona bicolor]|uniref:Uncharacterized protein n=1 Tax=Melipona bicolor TaxID=60889 RepID=A0AA40KV90_9HYME|nr:hypothetical protein K0M31_011995 [Melipona bicolor]
MATLDETCPRANRTNHPDVRNETNCDAPGERRAYTTFWPARPKTFIEVERGFQNGYLIAVNEPAATPFSSSLETIFIEMTMGWPSLHAYHSPSGEREPCVPTQGSKESPRGPIHSLVQFTTPVPIIRGHCPGELVFRALLEVKPRK